MNARTTAAAVALAAAVLTVAAACGSQRPAVGTSTPRPSSSLVITVHPGPGASAHRWTLTCGPAGGSLPNAATACRVLSTAKDPFAPVPHGMMCPMIYSGPQTATIEGTWHGMPVHATYSRVNGCETERWSKLGQVFGPYATPSSAGTSPGTG